jgi:hypothetical protein
VNDTPEGMVLPWSPEVSNDFDRTLTLGVVRIQDMLGMMHPDLVVFYILVDIIIMTSYRLRIDIEHHF